MSEDRMDASVEEWLELINVNTKRIADALEKRNEYDADLRKALFKPEVLEKQFPKETIVQEDDKTLVTQ